MIWSAFGKQQCFFELIFYITERQNQSDQDVIVCASQCLADRIKSLAQEHKTATQCDSNLDILCFISLSNKA